MSHVVYEDLVARLRSIVRRTVPPDATVLVVSKGDRKIIDLDGRRGWHFPQRADGVYAGHYPADSTSAIDHLESLRAKGAEFLVFPSTAFWWLDHYPGLRDHLQREYRLFFRDETCRIYALVETLAPRPNAADVPEEDRDAMSGPERPSAASEGPAPAVLAVRSGGALRSYGDERLIRDLRAVFDAAYYQKQIGSPSADDPDAVLVNYLETGALTHANPTPLFDTAFYLERNPAVRVSGMNPLIHFLEQSVTDARDPGPYFDTEYYYTQAEGLRASGVNALLHYVTAGAEARLNPNPLFGTGFYIRSYADVHAAGVAPFAHYLASGCEERRFASHVHQSIVNQLRASSRKSLLRGNWKNGAILFFLEGANRDYGMVAELTRSWSEQRHLECVVVALRRGQWLEEVEEHANVVILEDFESACAILRDSAVRLLARSLALLKPHFALSDVNAVPEILRWSGIAAYFLVDDVLERGEDLRRAVGHATRVIFPSPQPFHGLAQVLGKPPAKVAMRSLEGDRARDSIGPPASSAESAGDRDKYGRSFTALVQRDLGFSMQPRRRPAAAARQRPTRRVVIPCSDWSVSGVNASLEAIATELIGLGWDVEIVFTRDQPTVLRTAGSEAHLPRIPYRYLRRFGFGVEGMWEALIGELESMAPCILFMAYDFVANGVVAALTDDVAAVGWVQADDGDYYEQAYRLGRYCNAVVCVSQCIKDKISALNPALGEKSVVIHNSSVQSRDILARKSRPEETLKIIYTGRLVQYQKRILDFIELARALDETGVPYTITLIGTFAARDEAGAVFHERAAPYLDDGRIKLAGRLSRDDIFAELQRHDFFVLLSEFEGLPLALVEAIARGCVPVVSELESGVPEIITHGRNGIIVPGRDYRDWAEVLVNAWKDPTRFSRMSRNARKTVREKFVVEEMAKRFDDLFRAVANDLAAGTYERPASLNWGAERSTTGDVLPPPSLYRPVNVPGLP